MVVLDTARPEHATALDRLDSDQVAWLTTVSESGTPQSTPVWFLWEDGAALVFSQPDTPKVRNVSRNPGTGLHLNSDKGGGHVVALEGTIAVGDEPDAETLARYVAKYRGGLASLGMSGEQFRASYSVPLRFTPARVRAW